MSRPKHTVNRVRGPVPKKPREPYLMPLTLRTVTAKDIVRLILAHEAQDE